MAHLDTNMNSARLAKMNEDDREYVYNNLKEYPVNELIAKERKYLAEEDIKDIAGLSQIRDILVKYNITNVTIDFNLNVYCRFTKKFSPKEMESRNDKNRLH